MNKIILILFLSLINETQAQISQKTDTIIFKSDTLSYVIINKNNSNNYYEFKKNYLIKDGKAIMKFRNVTTILHYKNNLKQGIAKMFINDTLLVSEVNYKKGRLNGQYFDIISKEIYRYGNYRNGVRVNKWYYKNSEGVIKVTGRYSGRELKTFDMNGKLAFINFKGDTISFASNEEYNNFLSKYDYFIQGNKTWLRKGKWLFYDEKGKITGMTNYNSNGQIKYKKGVCFEQLNIKIE